MLNAIPIDFPDVEICLDALDMRGGDAICGAPDDWGGGGIL